MSDSSACTRQALCEVSPKLRPIVGLHHSKAKPKALLSSPYGVCCSPRQNPTVHLGICHAGIQIYDGIDVPSPLRKGADVVNGICLDELARRGNCWPPRIVWMYSLCTRTVKAMVASQYATHTTKRNAYTIHLRNVMPDDLGTASECGS